MKKAKQSHYCYELLGERQLDIKQGVVPGVCGHALSVVPVEPYTLNYRGTSSRALNGGGGDHTNTAVLLV